MWRANSGTSWWIRGRSTARWRSLPIPEGDRYAWDAQSTYVALPPFFEDLAPEPEAIPDILGGPNDTLIGNLIKQQFLETRDWPFGSVLSIVLTVAALALAGMAAWVGRRGAGAGRA